jgi:hypothetical protein
MVGLGFMVKEGSKILYNTRWVNIRHTWAVQSAADSLVHTRHCLSSIGPKWVVRTLSYGSLAAAVSSCQTGQDQSI